MIDFVGIQPSFRHVPPNSFFSNATTFKLFFIAISQASNPAGPKPIIAKSYILNLQNLIFLL